MKKLIILVLLSSSCFAQTFTKYVAYYPKTCKIQNAHMTYGHSYGVYQLNCIEEGKLKTYGTTFMKIRDAFIINHVPSETSHLYLEQVK